MSCGARALSVILPTQTRIYDTSYVSPLLWLNAMTGPHALCETNSTPLLITLPQVTRALRARLSYASYKATRNYPTKSLEELEIHAHTQSQAASFARNIAAKRKTTGSTSHYNSTATPSAGGAIPASARRHGSMLPPAPVSTRATTAATPSYSAYSEVASSSSRAGPQQAANLYASILAPPSTNMARTIHNPSDPPLAAPTRPVPSPRARVPPSPRHGPARSQSRARQSIKPPKLPASPAQKSKFQRGRGDKGKGKGRQADEMDVDADGDVDMKAAATLTLLMSHSQKPSLGASSPRSSIDGGSEVGSTHSFSHYAQSSARTSNLTAPPISVETASSASDASGRVTPPPNATANQQHHTPHAAPSDSEAADLMLFLATSPSPARKDKDKDMAAFRTLGGASKGRVLFHSTPASDSPSAHEDAPGSSSFRPATLTRGGETSFNSSVSSIGTEVGSGHRIGIEAPARTSSTTPTPGVPGPTSLLPPAPLPLPVAPASPARRKEGGASSKLSGDFNIHEFINPPPSLGRPIGLGSGSRRTDLGLRADVGRKLFEEEQLRHAQTMGSVPGKRQEERPLDIHF